MLSLARQRLLGLVHGLPGDRRRLRGLMALKVYKANIDGSGGVDRPVLILAGFVATVEQWLPFTDEWDNRLRQAGKPYVRMSDMENDQEIAAFFYRVVEEHATAGLAMAIPVAPLLKVCDELGYDPDSEMRNPYFLASKGIINCTAQCQREFGITEPIDFIFDRQTEERQILHAWDYYVEGRIPPEVRALTGERPQFLDDKKHPPLQAADIYAWWLRKAWENGGMDAFLRDWPFPWRSLRPNFPRFVAALNEDDIRSELSRAVGLKKAGVVPYRLSVTFGGLKTNDQT